MEDEIEYTYVRGKGWIPSSLAPWVFHRQSLGNGCDLVLLNRPPRHGERGYYTEGMTTAQLVDELSSNAASYGYAGWRYYRGDPLDAGHVVTVYVLANYEETPQ